MSKPAVARASVWNAEVYREVRQLIRRDRIQVAHFHNTYPLVSPAAYYAARAENVPVVQTLHNYRLLCPAATFYRDGRVCEDCLEHPVPWPSVVHSCYRGSRVQSAALAGMLSLHRAAGTWARDVDLYVALTDFARGRFVAGGLPPAKVVVKANFASVDSGAGSGHDGFALFVGRITSDKGVQVLAEAWRRLGGSIPLKIAGDGPMLESLTAQVENLPNVEVLGKREREDVLRLMKAARVLIVPSLWYEGFPMTIIEAYSCGLPVIASDLGSLSSVVSDGVTGLLFPAGDAERLAAAARRFYSSDFDTAVMRRNARAAFERSYTPEQGYAGLMSIYHTAQTARRARRVPQAGHVVATEAER
jgi:glycosyltransferase involved in cell wall biosynthesis